jgi:hypothetical protein
MPRGPRHTCCQAQGIACDQQAGEEVIQIMKQQPAGNERTGINVSVPPAKRAEFFAAIDFLRAHHRDRLIGNAPLSAEAIIAYHKLLQTLQILFPDLKTGDTLTVEDLMEAARTQAERQQGQQVAEGV